MYIYICHRALSVWGDRVFDSAFRLLLSGSFCFPINRAPPNLDGRNSNSPGQIPSLWAAFENHCFCYKAQRIYTISLSGFII